MNDTANGMSLTYAHVHFEATNAGVSYKKCGVMLGKSAAVFFTRRSRIVAREGSSCALWLLCCQRAEQVALNALSRTKKIAVVSSIVNPPQSDATSRFLAHLTFIYGHPISFYQNHFT